MKIYDYSDFRKYLKEYIENKKALNPAFSFRYVAHRLGCNPGFFNRIIKGERNLTHDNRMKIIELLKLKKKEKKYFELLVQFNQAKTQLEQEHFFKLLNGFQQSKIHKINSKQYSLYENWYNIVLRELLNILPCYDDSESTCNKLAQYIMPFIKAKDIQSSLYSLQNLNIITKEKSGRLKLNDKLISTGPEIPPIIVQRILRQFFQLGKESLERFEKEKRVCSTLTLSVSQKGYNNIKSTLSNCREEILRFVREDNENLDQVYHLNMQLFPVTSPISEISK